MNFELNKTLERIAPVDPEWIQRAERRQLELTKPPHSLGELENIANRLCAIQQTLTPSVAQREIYVFAASHGVCEENISPYPSAVTRQMVLNFLNGGAAINALAKIAGAELTVIDVGVDGEFNSQAKNFVQAKVANGTKNFTGGAAMSEDEMTQALRVGFDAAKKAQSKGTTLIGLGEMGIGNTTAASAITAALLNLEPETTTGRGTGADDETWRRKIETVRRAIAINQPDANDAFDVLRKVGGLEIAALVGLIISAAANRTAIITDGFIATAAAALAVKAHPAIAGYIFAAHLSVEQGHASLLEYIKQKPLFDLQMRLGEGTGAALAMNVIAAAVAAFLEMATFESASISNRI